MFTVSYCWELNVCQMLQQKGAYELQNDDTNKEITKGPTNGICVKSIMLCLLFFILIFFLKKKKIIFPNSWQFPFLFFFLNIIKNMLWRLLKTSTFPSLSCPLRFKQRHLFWHCALN